MKRPRKHPRADWFFSDALLKTFAEAAKELPLREVSRRFAISTTTVRRAMKIHKVPARRVGHLTNAEIAAVKRTA